MVVLRILLLDRTADVFELLDLPGQEQLLKAMGREETAGLLNNMAPDDRTLRLEELPANMTKQLLAQLTPEERAVAVSLLGHPERSIGRLMTPDYIAVREEWSLQYTLEYIREHGRDSETPSLVYVVDEQCVVIDDIHIRSLLLAPPQYTMADLMDHQFVALKATDDQETAIAVFEEEHRTVLPVTDTLGVLIGIVTIDNVLRVAEAAATAMGFFEKRDRKGGRAGSVYPTYHFKQRELRVASLDPGRPSLGHRRDRAARLVAGDAAGVHCGLVPRFDPRNNRVHGHRPVVLVRGPIWAALAARRADRRDFVGGRGDVGSAERLAVAVHFAPARFRPSGLVRPLCRDDRRCDGIGHLFQCRVSDYAGDVIVTTVGKLTVRYDKPPAPLVLDTSLLETVGNPLKSTQGIEEGGYNVILQLRYWHACAWPRASESRAS